MEPGAEDRANENEIVNEPGHGLEKIAKKNEDEENVDENDFDAINEENGFRLQTRSIFCTYPQCPITPEEMYKKIVEILKGKGISIKVAIFCQEDHKQADGKHIHGYFEMDKKINTRDPRVFDVDGYHPNFQSAKNKIKIIRYISGETKKKKGDPKVLFQYRIDYKTYLQTKKDHKTYFLPDLLNKKKRLCEVVDEEPEMIYKYGAVKRNLAAYWADKAVQEFNGKRKCFWIWGKPGIGKSFNVREAFKKGTVYVKGNHKWWDNYIDQRIVLIEDLDGSSLSHYIKIWADSYEFDGETKGGSVTLTYNLLLITSNYTIYELFGPGVDFEDEKDMKLNPKQEQENDMKRTLVEAIERRFTIINANNFVTLEIEEGKKVFDMGNCGIDWAKVLEEVGVDPGYYKLK